MRIERTGRFLPVNSPPREEARARLAFVLISKLYRQMYANTGIATDGARVSRSAMWARWIAKPVPGLEDAVATGTVRWSEDPARPAAAHRG